MSAPNITRWPILTSLVEWLTGYLRFGGPKDSVWRPYHQFGSAKCSTAFLVIGGLSSNGAMANRLLSRSLHRAWKEAHTWSRNLSGHTGRFFDYSNSRFWHWLTDGFSALKKLIDRYGKDNIVLIGHSTGGLVVLALAIFFSLMPKWIVPADRKVSVRTVLLFPAFRLKRRRDAVLLTLVGILYYVLCPLAFVLLAMSGPWMWPMSLLAFLLHITLVPQISVPSGEERARQEGVGTRWYDVPEGVLLGLACIYFVVAPPLIALVAGALPGALVQTMFAVFILTLLTPMFLIPREVEPRSFRVASRQPGFQWMPCITVANLIILQYLMRPLLRFVRCPVLVLIGGRDEVVEVPPTWVAAIGGGQVQTRTLPEYPHSGFNVQQQAELADIILKWCDESAELEEGRVCAVPGRRRRIS